MNDFIEIKGARENNLKDVTLKIPKGKITIFTGVSGSGKSSIVFDTIAQEAGRLLNENFSAFARTFLPSYSRPDADEINNLSAAVAIDQTPLGGNMRSTLGTATEINTLFRLLFSRFGAPSIGYGNAYSFNDPLGMCPTCEGIGQTVVFNAQAAIDFEKSLNEGAMLLPGFEPKSYYWQSTVDCGLFDADKKIKDYTPQELDVLLNAKAQKVAINYRAAEFNATFEGLAERFMRTKVKTEREASAQGQKAIDRFTQLGECPTCKGKRYNDTVLNSRINGKNMYDYTSMQVDELLVEVRKIDDPNAKPIVDAIYERLKALDDIGLGYLTLTRATPTLSGGESQRIKMVKHLSSSLVGMLYIFDEPSIGLHPRDVHRLNEMLIKLRDKGNTVLVVEHDPDVIKIADHIVDVGPRAGAHGGEIVFEGTYNELQNADTLTAKYLSIQRPINENPRSAKEFYESEKSALHNLKNVALRVPKGLFTVVTGVAGSGKSTLVNGVFLKQYPDALRITQRPLAANSRSNAATFADILNGIRKCFATANGVDTNLFSANSKGGCDVCGGSGTVTLNLSFMDKVEVECSACGGKRFKPEVLQYLFKNRTIVDVMDMTIDEALEFFEEKEIRAKLKGLATVGLGYLTLGQPLSTVSGGESQRLKLARELSKQGNIYILDEPTTGLHLSDIETIIAIIQKLVNKGNTVVVIEHNVDVMRQCDWIIDIGPESGNGGGEILYEGPPAGIKTAPRSITAKYI